MTPRQSITAAELSTFLKKGRSKYNVDRSDAGKMLREYNGRVYDSAAEMRHAMQLDILLKAGSIRSWYGQEKIPLIVAGVKICTFIPDFRVVHNDGSVEWFEIKGVETQGYRLKAKLFRALHPGMKLTVVKV